MLNALPKSAQPAARKGIVKIRDAEDREQALAATKNFERNFGAKWPAAVAKIVDDAEALLSFFDYPAEHWIHSRPPTRSSQPSPPVAYGPRSPKDPAREPPGCHGLQTHRSGPGPMAIGQRPNLVALVRAGTSIRNGVRIERSDEEAAA